jgi:protein TonB
VVDNRPQPPKASEKPAASGAEQLKPKDKVVPTTSKATKAPPQAKATPLPAKSKTAGSEKAVAKTDAAPPKAGSGAKGNKGADVVTVKTEGIEFPDQGYLNNIVRQLSLAWLPGRAPASYVTEVKFTIRRDGSVINIEVVKGSGNRLYDVEAMGAIESVGSSRKFGQLPAVWTDDVLIVYFTFDYAMLK